MATVLVAPYGADPSTIWPEKYSSCFWNFVTGWVCETIDQPVNGTTTATDPVNGFAPISDGLSAVAIETAGRNCGCCGNGDKVSPGSPSGAVAIAGSLLTAGKCRCGYTNREALFALGVAVAFFLLVRE